MAHQQTDQLLGGQPTTARAEHRMVEEEFIVGEGLDDLDDAELFALQKKFRCKRDLYSYLAARSKCFYF